ncbi:hypothetical protein [Dermabacter hominis]|uniref:hypothetical protein n=1 Tax=Dermabacter hominis TaxID=36740 RepID=UPI0021A294EE|nr:hypothetical protein [Dermabacter hominis]MCT1717196.1 hypothetical protein [Dermabacter hominis]
MTGTETQLSGRRHGRRARAVSGDENNTSATRGVTGDLTLYARRTAVIPPVADDQLPELKHYTGKRAKRRADVPVEPAVEAKPEAHVPSEPVAAVETEDGKAAEQTAPQEVSTATPDPLSDDLPAASVGTKKGSWPGARFGREAVTPDEPATDAYETAVLDPEEIGSAEEAGNPATSDAIDEAESAETAPAEPALEPTEQEPAEARQASAWTSVPADPETSVPSASEALAPKPADPETEPAPVYETSDGTPLSDASEWLEVGDLPADQAPEPKPAARFDGTVLDKPSRTSGGIGMWITWLLVAAIAITLVVLLVTGVIGPGIAKAIAPIPETVPYDLSGGLAS